VTAGATEITVRPLVGRRDWKLFENLPELLHAGHAAFIPPIPGTVTVLRKANHPFHLHGDLFPFLAFRGGEPVGRVAAIVNRTHNQHHQDNVGFVGFFDCIDDPEVAQVLFRAAEKELSRRGLGTIRGPFSPTQNDPCGVLVDGYQYPPTFLMPWNPPYYTGLWEAAGWRGVQDLYGYRMPLPYAPVHNRTSRHWARRARMAERFKRKSGVTVRPGSKEHFRQDLEIIQALFNNTLKHEWNFMPLIREDLEYAARDLRWILDPGLILIAEHEGIPVGFSLSLPDVNEFAARAARWAKPLRVLHVGLQTLFQRPRGFRVVALGVLPEYDRSGLAPLFYHETNEYGSSRYTIAEVSWVQAANEEMTATLKALQGDRYKTYRVFEKTLPGG
jgi:hypothetical protein